MSDPDKPATIGSSDAAAILGASPWRGPWDVWPGIVGLAPRYSRTDNPAQRRGRRLEQVVLDWYAEDYGVELEPGPDVFDPAHRPLVRDGWAHDHPDAFEVSERITRAGSSFHDDVTYSRAVEVKSLQFFNASIWGRPGSDQVPLWYLMQCVHHEFVTGLPVVLVAFATGTDELRVYSINVDAKLVARQAEMLKAWHQAHVVEGRPPPLDGSDGCARGLAALYEYGDRDKDYRTATPREVEIAREIAEIRNEIKRLEVDVGQRENTLRTMIGANYGLKAGEPERSIALWYPTTTFDEAAFAEAHPDIDLDAFRKPASVDRKALRKAHPDLEAAHSHESGRTFRLYPKNLPTPGEGEGEGW